MASLISNSDLKDANEFTSRVHRMLKLEYFEEHAKFWVEEDERSHRKEEFEWEDEDGKDVSDMIEDMVERKDLYVANVNVAQIGDDANSTLIKGDRVAVIYDIDF